MKKKKGTARKAISLDEIKRLVVIAMFSDDELMDQLVLKGGNALDLIHKITTRASVDVDFSIATDFTGGFDAAKEKIAFALDKTFRDVGLKAFDVHGREKPAKLSPEVADFWGGYDIEFKLVAESVFVDFHGDMDAMRKRAIPLGEGARFLIDISRFEYVEGKEATTLDGHRVFVYSAAMLAAEKLRALCQQMPEYGQIVKRTRKGAPRARDFLDIYKLIESKGVDLATAENHALLRSIFHAKRVPLQWLGELHRYRQFHEVDFPSVLETVRPGEKVEAFEFYFDFVLRKVRELEPLWNE